MRRAAVGAAVRHHPSGVVVRLGRLGPTPRASVSPIPGFLRDATPTMSISGGAEVAERLLPAAQSRPGRRSSSCGAPTASSHCIGFGNLLWRIAAAASAFSNTGTLLAPDSPPGTPPTPIDAAAAEPRFTAAPEVGQDRGIGVGGLVAVVAHSSVSLSVVFSRLLVRCLLLPSRDPYFVQCEPISGRL